MALENIRITYQFVAPSKPMLDTKGLGKKLSDNFESHLHDHLEIIVDSSPIEFQGVLVPTSFRSEWLLHAKENSVQEKELDAWFRLIITFKISDYIQIHNIWIDKLSGKSNSNIEIINHVSTYMDELIPKCLEGISNNFEFNFSQANWNFKS